MNLPGRLFDPHPSLKECCFHFTTDVLIEVKFTSCMINLLKVCDSVGSGVFTRLRPTALAGLGTLVSSVKTSHTHQAAIPRSLPVATRNFAASALKDLPQALASRIHKELNSKKTNDPFFLNGQRTRIDVSPETYTWPRNAGREVRRHRSLGKHTSKPQWGAASRPL